MKRIGVLAVQGAFDAHARVLTGLGHHAMLVRAPRDLTDLEGLVLPGGESTVQLELVARLELESPLRALVARKVPVLATCAGLILAASRVAPQGAAEEDAPLPQARPALRAEHRATESGDPLPQARPALRAEHRATESGALPQRCFGFVDVEVARNAWGRQVDSFEATSDRGRHLVFIRAPRIVAMGPRVEVLDTWRGEPVLVREGGVTCATFHPELTEEREVIRGVFGGYEPSPPHVA